MPEPGTERLRGEARNEQLRAQLEPLAPGERPPVITAAALASLILGVVNGAGAVADLGDDRALLTVLALLALGVSAGLWRVEYWAALIAQIGFAITAIFAFGALLVAPDLTDALIALAGLVVSSTFFWKMVRPLGRMQAPARE